MLTRQVLQELIDQAWNEKDVGVRRKLIDALKDKLPLGVTLEEAAKLAGRKLPPLANVVTFHGPAVLSVNGRRVATLSDIRLDTDPEPETFKERKAAARKAAKDRLDSFIERVDGRRGRR